MARPPTATRAPGRKVSGRGRLLGGQASARCGRSAAARLNFGQGRFRRPPGGSCRRCRRRPAHAVSHVVTAAGPHMWGRTEGKPLSNPLEQIMRSKWRSGLLAFVSVLAIATTVPSLQGAAQQNDIAAAQKRFQDLYAAGDYSAALAEAQKNEAAAKRGGTNNFAYVSALNDLARAHQALGRYAEAAGMFRQVVGTMQKNLPPGDPRLAQPLANLATVYLLQANPGEAEKLYKQALDISTKAQSGPNQNVALLMSNLADVYKAQARYDEAEAQYKRALDMADKAGGPTSLLVALILN